MEGQDPVTGRELQAAPLTCGIELQEQVADDGAAGIAADRPPPKPAPPLGDRPEDIAVAGHGEPAGPPKRRPSLPWFDRGVAHAQTSRTRSIALVGVTPAG